MKRNSLILPALAVVGFTFMTWHLMQTNRPAPAADPPVQPSRTAFEKTIAGSGLVEPKSENIDVAAIVPGTVAEVFVKVGQQVRQGEPLFRLDDRQRQADVRVQQARLVQAQADLHRLEQLPRKEDLPPSAARVSKAQADVKARKDELDRAEELVAQKIWTSQDYIQREQAFLAARALLEQAQAEDAKLKAGAWEEELTVARAEVEMAKAAVEQSKTEIDRLVVTSPIAATILKVDVRPGEYIGTPPGQPLIVLGDTTTLHVRVDIDEQDLPRFRPGLSGLGYVRGDAATALPMTFVRVEPYVEPKRSLTNSGTERVDTRVLQVIYAIDPEDQSLYVGQQIDVFLNAGG